MDGGNQEDNTQSNHCDALENAQRTGLQTHKMLRVKREPPSSLHKL